MEGAAAVVLVGGEEGCGEGEMEGAAVVRRVGCKEGCGEGAREAVGAHGWVLQGSSRSGRGTGQASPLCVRRCVYLYLSLWCI
jgi:hypothetical protein